MVFRQFSKIGQLRDTIVSVQRYLQKVGQAETTLNFVGTVKLHGTNAAIGYNRKTGEVWAQSRHKILTPEDDNHGFAKWVELNKAQIQDGMAFATHFTSLLHDYAYLYGEWAGMGVAKGVGISKENKAFYAFDLVISDGVFDEEGKSKNEIIYTDLGSRIRRLPVRDIKGYQTYRMSVTIPAQGIPSSLGEFHNQVVDITRAVEAQCPVAEALGHEGIGEGVVWTCQLSPSEILRFKVKGEKHSTTKVKTTNAMDIEKLESLERLTDALVTENRLNQGLEVMREMGYEVNRKNTGQFIKWVVSDIHQEDLDVVEVSGFTWKEAVPSFTAKARIFWFSHTDVL